MAEKKSKAPTKLIVIDANIAGAAGESTHPDSSNCRVFLESVLKICHKAILTPQLDAEWQGVRSRIFQRWRVDMENKGKIVYCQSKEEYGPRLEVLRIQESSKKAIRKDVHMLEAAMEHDGIFASNERKLIKHMK